MYLQIVAMLLVGLRIMLFFSRCFCSGWFYCSWLIEGDCARNKCDEDCSLCKMETKHKLANPRVVWGNGVLCWLDTISRQRRVRPLRK